jgi:hypothetical protein
MPLVIGTERRKAIQYNSTKGFKNCYRRVEGAAAHLS